RDRDVIRHEHQTHTWFMLISGAIALAGIYVAYRLHLRDRTAAERLVEKAPGFVNALDHKYWVDEVYQAGIVEPLRALGRVLFWIDSAIVDNVFNVIGYAPQVPGFLLKVTTQRGYLQGYAAAMLLGIAAILLIFFL